MSNEWKDIKTAEHIPKPETWDQYEWRGDIHMISTNEVFTPVSVIVYFDSEIAFRSCDTAFTCVSYRPKPFPSDEYILSHLWNHGGYETFQEAEIWPSGRFAIWGVE